jgi:hypothetical protein
VIEETMEKWHRHLRGELEGGLDELLDDDCVFYSPIVFSPQRGKELTKMYLNAAGATFTGGSKGESPAAKMKESSFRYSKEVLCGNHAVLEFESKVGDTYVNGVDIITCNDAGRIIEFKVMIRPLQAVNMMHKQMAAMLEKMKK